MKQGPGAGREIWLRFGEARVGRPALQPVWKPALHILAALGNCEGFGGVFFG